MKELLTKSSALKKRKRGTGGQNAPAGEITFINVPKPPASAFNKDRPIGCLLQAQLKHIHHAENARLPKEKRDGRRPEDIHTEAEAAAYIAAVTAKLHPQRRRKPRPKTARP
ncbi:MAG: hypothetical protein ABR923_05745 [Terracidiphilus sp.]|jgi:hypothetical protein